MATDFEAFKQIIEGEIKLIINLSIVL